MVSNNAWRKPRTVGLSEPLTVEIQFVLLPQQALDQVVSLRSQIHALQKLLLGQFQAEYR